MYKYYQNDHVIVKSFTVEVADIPSFQNCLFTLKKCPLNITNF